MMSNTKKGIIYAVIAMLCYASTPTLTKMAYNTGLTMTSLLFGRFSVATLIGIVLLKIKKEKMPAEKNLMKGLLIIGIFSGMSSMLFNQAYIGLHSIIATVISLSYVIIVQVIELIGHKENRNTKGYITIGLTIVGLLVISGITGKTEINIAAFITGIIASIFYSLQLCMMNYRNMKKVSTEILMVCTNLAVVFVAIGMSAITGDCLLPETSEQLIYIVILAVVNAYITKYCFFRAVRLLGASRAGMIDMLEPVASAVLGFVLLDETIGMDIALGVVIIMAAIIISLRDKR